MDLIDAMSPRGGGTTLGARIAGPAGVAIDGRAVGLAKMRAGLKPGGRLGITEKFPAGTAAVKAARKA